MSDWEDQEEEESSDNNEVDDEDLLSITDEDLDMLESDLKQATSSARFVLKKVATLLPRILQNLESRIAAQEEAKMWPDRLLMMAVQANRMNDVAIKTLIAIWKVSGKKGVEGPLVDALKAMEKDGLI